MSCLTRNQKKEKISTDVVNTKTIMSLTKDLNNDDLTVENIDSLYEAVLIAFNKNKEGRRFT